MRGIPFNMPNIQGHVYDPGMQPYSPGVSSAAFFPARPIVPWPRAVDTLHTLASHPGTPRSRALIPDVNQYGPLPANYLFLGGVVGKSKG
jgi:hypothetical protein